MTEKIKELIKRLQINYTISQKPRKTNIDDFDLRCVLEILRSLESLEEKIKACDLSIEGWRTTAMDYREKYQNQCVEICSLNGRISRLDQKLAECYKVLESHIKLLLRLYAFDAPEAKALAAALRLNLARIKSIGDQKEHKEPQESPGLSLRRFLKGRQIAIEEDGDEIIHLPEKCVLWACEFSGKNIKLIKGKDGDWVCPNCGYSYGEPEE